MKALRRHLIAELKGTVCACGARKASRQTFCRAQYFRLPAGMRQALYDPMGEGYEEAYQNACKFLGIELPKIEGEVPA